MISTRFRTKVLFVTVLPVIATALILASVLISERINEFDKQINEKGNNIASYLSPMSEYGIFSNSFSYLESTLTHTLNQQDITAIYIEDNNKSIVLKRFNGNEENIDIQNIDKKIHKVFTSSIIKTSIEINDIKSELDKTPDNNIIVGTVNIVMNLSNANILKTQIIKNGVFITFILTLATIFVALLFSRSVTKPITNIHTGVNIIKKGGLQHRIPVSFSGELAELAHGINNMTSSLEVAQSKEKLRNDALVKAKQEAERANRAKSLFISSMSHEMRTPMNAILGFSQLIEADAKDDLTKENVREITHAGKHLLELIDDLLELSLIESGKVKLCIESYNLKETLDFCLSMVKSSTEKMSIRIDNKVDSLPDIKIHVDNKRFKQIVLNLLSNAIKYNNKNGNVIIDYSIEDEKMLCLSITDTGKGIAPHYHDNLFNLFDRAGQECSTITGTGLGLAISKKLIEKMNGTIGFESTIGEGSHFWVKVPLA